jgi:hypothetical protein
MGGPTVTRSLDPACAWKMHREGVASISLPSRSALAKSFDEETRSYARIMHSESSRHSVQPTQVRNLQFS